MTPKLGHSEYPEVSPSTLTVKKDVMKTAVSIDQAAPEPPAKTLERNDEHAYSQPNDNEARRMIQREQTLKLSNSLIGCNNTLSIVVYITLMKEKALDPSCTATGAHLLVLW